MITRTSTLCRLALLAVLFLGSISLLTQSVQAQATVTVSPTSLSFGVPTGSTVSAPQTVTVSATGTGTVTVSVPASAGPYTTSSNTCSTLTLPPAASCTFDVTYTPSAAAGTLQSATLTVTTSAGSPTVALTGALGAIKLFTPVNVAPSNGSASPSNPYQFDSTTVALSCPAPEDPSPTGVLSSTPDGSGNVLVDNFVIVGSNTDGGEPSQNVCSGTGAVGNNCFTSAYQGAASAGALNGDDPDTFTNGGNSVLAGGAAGGIPPIDVSGFLFGDGQTIDFTVDFQDGGGWVTSSTLFLVTNCTPPGNFVPGGTVSGNPVNPTNPSSLVQTLTLDSNPGNTIQFSFNFSNAPSTTSTAPRVTDIGIDQTTYASMVAGSSAAPTQCLHLTGELDSNGNPLCKAFLFECPDANGNFAGTNCAQSTIRDLLFEARFDSEEISGVPSFSSYTFAPGTGPAFVTGPDNWVTPGSDGTVTSGFPSGGSVSSPCSFPPGSNLYNQLCPQNPLTEFYGAEDSKPGGPVSPNSIFVPAVNMPLPFTAATDTTSTGGNDWNNSTTVGLKFVANPAVCPSGNSACAPPANGFVQAPIQSETYGFTAANTAVPDPTFPVAGDTVLPNSGSCPATTSGPFTATSSAVLSEGIYNMHYFATDCALTEELVFLSGNIPSQNWASFHTLQIGVDTTAPTVACGSPSPAANGNGWNNTAVTVACTATDQNYVAGTSGSGFTPLLANSIQGSPSENFNLVAAVPGPGYGTSTATTSQTIADLARNAAAIPTYTFKIDTVAPTITAPALSPTTGSYTVGQVATVKYGCADVGSGIATCADNFTGSGGAMPVCTGAISAQTCTLDTSTSGVGSHKVSISATDLAGNSAGPAIASYSVSYVPVTLGILPLPAIATPGKTLTFVVLAGDITPAKAPVTAYGVNITTQLVITNTDLGTGAIAAKAGEVTCTAWPCTVTPSSGAACTVTSTPGTKTTSVAISCPIGTLVDLFSGKTAAGVSITVPIATKAPLGSITTSGGITSASPYTGTTTFSGFPVPIL